MIPFEKLLVEVGELLLQNGPASLLHIEHDVSPNRVYAQAYRSKGGDKYAEEIGFWDTTINFTSLWNLTFGKKYDQISEYLEMIFVEGEEEYAYSHLFHELALLRGYKILKSMLQSVSLKNLIHEMNTTWDFSICICQHDFPPYVIYG